MIWWYYKILYTINISKLTSNFDGGLKKIGICNMSWYDWSVVYTTRNAREPNYANHYTLARNFGFFVKRKHSLSVSSQHVPSLIPFTLWVYVCMHVSPFTYTHLQTIFTLLRKSFSPSTFIQTPSWQVHSMNQRSSSLILTLASVSLFHDL